MKQLIIFIFCILSISNIYTKAQEINIKEGAYRNIVDFHTNKPFINGVKFEFAHQTKENIYSLKTRHLKISYNRIQFDTWAIYQDSTLYINLKRLGMGYGFAKILILGRYSFFIGRVRKTAAHKEYIKRQTDISGIFGWLLAEYVVAKGFNRNDMFVIDLQKGLPDNLDPGYLRMALQKDKDLLQQYLEDPLKENVNTMLFYLSNLNSRLPIY